MTIETSQDASDSPETLSSQISTLRESARQNTYLTATSVGASAFSGFIAYKLNITPPEYVDDFTLVGGTLISIFSAVNLGFGVRSGLRAIGTSQEVAALSTVEAQARLEVGQLELGESQTKQTAEPTI